MVFSLLLFLALSLLLYALFGGADFGAGILEMWRMGKMGKQEHALVQRAMASCGRCSMRVIQASRYCTCSTSNGTREASAIVRHHRSW